MSGVLHPSHFISNKDHYVPLAIVEMAIETQADLDFTEISLPLTPWC